MRQVLWRPVLALAGFAAGLLIAPWAAVEPDPGALENPKLAELFDPQAMSRAMCGGSSSRWKTTLTAMAVAAESTADATPAPPPRLWDGLGNRTFKITTTSPEAQAFFDQGLRLIYAYNTGEGLASFRAAEKADPTCAMCLWGQALAQGPFPLGDTNFGPARIAATRAMELAKNATPREQAMIAAIDRRYSDDKKAKRDALDDAYAAAMKDVAAAYKDDLDIAALYAASLMNTLRDPGWDDSGRTPSADMTKLLAVIEDILARDPDHAGAIHFYIHMLDDSAIAEKAEPFADKLAALMPGAGHMVHMPAHIYFVRGRYIDALKANVDAIAIDDVYLSGASSALSNYKYGLYYHNMHFAIASADMAGDGKAARDMAARMTRALAENEQRVFNFDLYGPAALFPIVNFGTPEEALALPEPDRKHAYMRGVRHYARGTAYARLGDSGSALAEANAIAKLRARGNKRAFAKTYPAYDEAAPALGIAELMVRARVATSKGDWSRAIRDLERAAKFDDELRGQDPPLWDFPVRQVLGVALIRAGRHKDAIDVLRAALLDAPNSGYALYALKEASVATGDAAAASAYGQLFEKAWSGVAPPDLNRL